jgi:hypothetical protein
MKCTGQPALHKLQQCSFLFWGELALGLVTCQDWSVKMRQSAARQAHQAESSRELNVGGLGCGRGAGQYLGEGLGGGDSLITKHYFMSLVSCMAVMDLTTLQVLPG